MAEQKNDTEEGPDSFGEYDKLIRELCQTIRAHVRSLVPDGEEPKEIYFALRRHPRLPYEVRLVAASGEARDVAPFPAASRVVASIASLLDVYPPERWSRLEITLSTFLGSDHAVVELIPTGDVDFDAMKDPVTVDPEVMHGAPCFRGTRVPVATLFDLLFTHGRTVEYFLDQFPTVRREQVEAVLRQANEARAQASGTWAGRNSARRNTGLIG